MKPGYGRIDLVLIVTVLMIAVMGILAIYSATYVKGETPGHLNPTVVKQIIWVIFGLLLMLIIASFDYIHMLNLSYLAYILTLLLLLYLMLFGGERFGAKRWIDLGVISIQPSEFAKITVIFVLAGFLGARKDKVGSLDNYVYSALIVMPAFLLIFLQPDLGTSLVLIPILFAILFVCGENIKYILTTFILGLLSVPILWNLLKDYQKSRLLVFINPNIDPLGAGYTIIQSRIAIGSGGIFGKGWLNGTQSQLKFLPERHTDFIFSVIGEEWGFMGGVVLLGLFSLLIYRSLKIIDGVDDISGKAVVTGAVTLIAFQVLVNIAMTIGLMPVVGLPLPMISYGGSNALAFLVCMGFILSVSRVRKR
ncbi:MAG: rod shape-determining protein RodA [Candidatus Omnitrophica bacterium]|nr:rod shape-determining protein RodA [Candidatus Omnitrophota bacterium]